MERKRDGLVPIGDAFSDLDDGPWQALRDASPQARYHFTQADQVNQLVTASEADPDLGFMARLLALCSLPRTNPGNRWRYIRQNGPYKLIMISGGDTKLPFGNLPRLLLAWVCTEAVRTQSRELVLGSSLSEFMRKLGMAPVGGGTTGARTRLRNQIDRLFAAQISLIYEDKQHKSRVSSLVADRAALWWNPKRPDEPRALGKQDPARRGLLHRNHQPPRATGHEHPQGSQTLSVGPGSIPVGRLPDIHVEAPDAAFLAAPLPPVRSRPGQGGR